MLKPSFVAWMVSVGLMVLGAGVVSGQDYPNKPIRIVTGGAGGGTDFMSRLIAPRLTGSLGQPVIVDNRGNVVLVGEIVSKAPPDGYTLLVYANPLWIGSLIQKTPYDPVKDFSPITLAASTPNILVVHPSLPVKSVKELVAFAKAKPGELNYSAGNPGASNHLAAELFKALAGVNIVHIPYKGTGPALNALIGGEVHLSFPSASAVTPHVRSGRLKSLAVTSIEPSALAPGLPTVAASGLPGYDSTQIVGVFAPAKTPATIINRLNEEIVRFLETAETKERLLSSGVEVIGSSPEKLTAAMKSEMARLGKIIKDAGIHGD